MSDSAEAAPSNRHRSVLLSETLQHLALKPGDTVVDCTLGAGGHSAAFIERIQPGGKLIGLDVDPQALELARARLEPLAAQANVALELIQANFSTIGEVAGARAIRPQAIFADLGVSSMQLDTPERGFSFRFDQPLDMRMDPTLPRTAADILREASQEEIADMLFHLGEERKSRRIARAVVEQRERQPITTTGQLEELVRRALHVRGHRRVHPATKTFQALRIAVNREMEVLAAFLQAAPEALSAGGRLGVITFHSLEDRPVKQAFKALDATGRFQMTVKFVAPGREEESSNPRSRSAKLRVLQRNAD